MLRDTTGDDAETGSMISSTFSLGEPLETASTQSVTDEQMSEADVTLVADKMQNASIDEGMSSTPKPQSSIAPSVSSTADTQGDETMEVPLNQCLFCNFVSEDVDASVVHMSNKHGMYIPEREYLEDLEGLLGYLYEKIHDIHECLYCGQVKHTASGIQTHMRDRGHCMISYQTEEDMIEIGDFYDFRSTYSDAEDEDDEDEDQREGGVKLGAARATKITVEGREDEELADEEDEGWESDASSLSSVPTDEITSVPIDDHSHRYKTLNLHRHHSHTAPRPQRNTDGFHSHAHSTPHAVYHDDVELHLPSGRTAGHRSMNKYWRQNLRNYPTPAEREHQRMIEEGRHDSDEEMQDAGTARQQRERGRQQLVSRANGGLGMLGVSDTKKKEVRAVEKKDLKRAMRAQKKYELGTSKRMNSQKHYRVSYIWNLRSGEIANCFRRILCFSSRLRECVERLGCAVCDGMAWVALCRADRRHVVSPWRLPMSVSVSNES